MVARIHALEWERDESVSIPRSGARFTLRLHFLNNGFLTNDRFLDDWIPLSARGRIGTTLGFRKRFCEANHYQIKLPSTKWGPVVEVWGFAVPYVVENGKPRLIRVLSRDWLLKQVGRSVRPPAFCARKR